MKKSKNKLVFLTAIFFIFFVLSSFGYVWEGFEKENLWIITLMDNNAINSLETTGSKKTEGNKALEISLDATKKDIKGYLSREGSFDLSKITKITFDIFLQNMVTVSVGITTGKDYVWYETEGFELKKGWNKNVKLNLDKEEWKNELTNWDSIMIPDNLDDTKKIVFVFRDGQKGKVYIDNMKFTGQKIENPAYTMEYQEISKKNIEDGYFVLTREGLVTATWAKIHSPEVKLVNGIYELNYNNVNNIRKAAYKTIVEEDFSIYSKIIMKLKNISNNYPCGIAMGFQIGDEWEWYETPQVLLKPNINTTVVIHLNAEYYKTEGSKWKHGLGLKNIEELQSITFLIYGLYGQSSTGKVKIEKFELLKLDELDKK